MLSENDKYQLHKMRESNRFVDKTAEIRDAKHSSDIRRDILTLIRLKKENADLLVENKEKFEELSVRECFFLFSNYLHLYNMILKEDSPVIFKLLDILARIESGELDQTEGSVLVGTYLKEIYVDRQLNETKRLDSLYPSMKPSVPKEIRWKEYQTHILGNT